MMESYRNAKKRGTMNTLTQLPKLLCTGIALFGATAIGNAQGTSTLTFEDIPTANYTVIPNGYGGLDWNNFFVQYTPASPPGYDYANGVVSSPNVAFNGVGNPASISSSSAFTLDSAYFATTFPPGDIGEDILFVYGFSGGTEVYGNSYIIYDSPTLINFDYANVDTVQFSTASGIQFAMDNMAVTVPEPSTFALSSLALAFGGLMSRRKKSRSGQ